MRRRRWKWAAVLALAASGCIPGQHLDPCEDAADCASGLECLQPRIVPESDGCASGGLGGFDEMACHLRCEDDQDCDALGADFVCATLGCEGSDRLCLRSSDTGPVLVPADGGS